MGFTRPDRQVAFTAAAEAMMDCLDSVSISSGFGDRWC